MNRQPAKSYEELLVWQKAHQFVLSTYPLTRQFPKEEIYALSAQLRRAAISIAANIAEGFRKRSRADKARFFNIAERSVTECHYYLVLVQDLRYCNTDKLRLELEEISRMLRAYRSALINSTTKFQLPNSVLYLLAPVFYAT